MYFRDVPKVLIKSALAIFDLLAYWMLGLS
jgi:hypothetical protein